MHELEKRVVARFVAERLPDVELLGLGSGTTVAKFIEELAKAEKYPKVIVSSNQIREVAESWGFDVLNEFDDLRPEITVDGADEIDPKGNLTKGGGGALLREKLLALNSERYVVIADHRKLVRRLGERFKIPIEVIPFGYKWTLRALEDLLGVRPTLRTVNDSPFFTDNGNYILDLPITVDRPSEVEAMLKRITGVVEVGIFVGLADEIYVAEGESVRKVK